MAPSAERGAARAGAGSPRRLSPTATWTGLLLLVTLVWGNSFIAIKHIVQYVTPLELVTVRFVPVAIGFAAWLLPARWREVVRLVREESWRLALLGLTGAVLYNTFLGWGETRVPAGTASLIIALNPAFTYALSVLALGERFKWQRALGMVIAFAGLFAIVRWGSGRPITLDEAGYAFITMLAPLCWAVYTILGKSVVARHPPLLVTGVSMIIAGLFSLIFVSPSLVARLPELPASFWWAVLFLSVPCTVFAFAVWFGALERMPAGRVAGFVYLVPMFAVTFSRLLLDEPLTLALVAGAAILIGGVWLVQRKGAA
ncbi:MAG: EamA family transporter [Anaerolineae bacterium]|nr:EamA family transporter [Anaerolineae bacterium]